MVSKATRFTAGFALAAVLGTTCGISTIRGCNGMTESRHTFNTLAERIRDGSVDAECIRSEKAERGLSAAIGPEKTKGFASKVSPAVDRYNREMAAATNEEEREEASLHLAGGVYRPLMSAEHANASTGQEVNYTFTFFTMFALGDASAYGADGAVFDPAVRRSISVLVETCKSGSLGPAENNGGR